MYFFLYIGTHTRLLVHWSENYERGIRIPGRRVNELVLFVLVRRAAFYEG